MFPRAFILFLLAALSVESTLATSLAKQNKGSQSSALTATDVANCPAPSQTVTVTVSASAATSTSSSTSTGSSSSGSTSGSSSGSSSNNSASGSAAGNSSTGSSTGSSKGSGKGSHRHQTTTAAASTASSTSVSSGTGSSTGSSSTSGSSTSGSGSSTGTGTNNAGSGGAAGNNNKGSGSSTTTTAVSSAATGTLTAAEITAAQSSTTLLPQVLATGFEQNGQGLNTSDPGQVPSLTSDNNFINFCATVNAPITNGLQIITGSCNPAPMGQIPAKTNMPSSKFVSPANLDTIPSNTSFTIKMAIENLVTGNFVNAKSNYYSAPQQVDPATGNIIGHSHFVIQPIASLTSTAVLDPTVFAFFQGVNTAAVNGVLSVTVTAGLPAGVYKLSSINAAANHQPALAPVAQHGSLDDCVYFTVTDSGKAAGNNAAAGGAAATGKGAAASASSAAAAQSSVAASAAASATAKATKGKGGKSGSSGKTNARRSRRFNVARH